MINPLQIDARLPWLLPALLSLVAIFVLSIAWISELYGANLQLFDNRNLNPCQLCIVQRYPYALIVVLGSAAILLSNRAMERTLLLSVISIVLVFGSYVSGFHIGVEYGWWTAGSACSAPIVPLDLSQEVFTLSTDGAPPPNCSDAAWRFPGDNGLSMAGYNFILSTVMATGVSFFSLASLNRLPRDS